MAFVAPIVEEFLKRNLSEGMQIATVGGDNWKNDFTTDLDTLLRECEYEPHVTFYILNKEYDPEKTMPNLFYFDGITISETY